MVPTCQLLKLPATKTLLAAGAMRFSGTPRSGIGSATVFFGFFPCGLTIVGAATFETEVRTQGAFLVFDDFIVSGCLEPFLRDTHQTIQHEPNDADGHDAENDVLVDK